MKKYRDNRNEATNALLMRILKVKTGFLIKNYIGVYEYEYGQLSDAEKNKIRQVWNLKTTDEAITIKLEALKEKLKA